MASDDVMIYDPITGETTKPDPNNPVHVNAVGIAESVATGGPMPTDAKEGERGTGPSVTGGVVVAPPSTDPKPEEKSSAKKAS
jgi:hypothetical protein